MEKNQTKPKSVCEKIFRAIISGPAFSTIRRLSNRQQTPCSTSVRPSDQRSKPWSKQGSELVPIKFDYTTKPKSITVHNGSTTQTNGAEAVPLMGQQAKTPKSSTADMVQSGNCKKATQHNHDERFTAFILETREKIMSRDHQDNNGGNSQKFLGHGHGGSRKDHHFSDYINQTKGKIKSTLSMKDK